MTSAYITLPPSSSSRLSFPLYHRLSVLAFTEPDAAITHNFIAIAIASVSLYAILPARVTKPPFGPFNPSSI